MLPPTMHGWPSRSSRCPAMAVVVLLPLVPVMQTTRRRSTPSSQSPSPPVTGMPAADRATDLGSVAADAGGLDHHVAAAQGAQPAASVASTGSPSTDSPGGRSSTSTGVDAQGPRAGAGWPRPRPRARRGRRGPRRGQTRRGGAVRSRPADRRRPVIGTVGRRDAVGADRGEQALVGRHQGPAARLGRGRTSRPAPGARPVGPLGPPGGRRPGTRSTSPTHSKGLVSGDVPTRASKRSSQTEIGQRLSTAEDGLELGGRQERGEDQVDEAALVAPPAPVVEPGGRVDREGPVAAAEDPVVALGERRTARPPRARCRGGAARSTRDRSRSRSARTRAKSSSKARSWSTGG